MNTLQEADRDKPRLGLRERKKAKTRAAIQEHALRLFREQGYPETTVEQIADAAEVSPSTFFRYFPTKEDVVLYDAFDPLLIEAFRAQPAGLSPIQAIRNAIRVVFGRLPTDELAQQFERGKLIFSVPELRLASIDQLIQTGQLLAEILAERVGRHPDELYVRNFTGALTGALIAAMLPVLQDPEMKAADFLTLMDESMAHLEAGLPL